MVGADQIDKNAVAACIDAQHAEFGTAMKFGLVFLEEEGIGAVADLMFIDTALEVERMFRCLLKMA